MCWSKPMALGRQTGGSLLEPVRCLVRPEEFKIKKTTTCRKFSSIAQDTTHLQSKTPSPHITAGRGRIARSAPLGIHRPALTPRGNSKIAQKARAMLCARAGLKSHHLLRRTPTIAAKARAVARAATARSRVAPPRLAPGAPTAATCSTALPRRARERPALQKPKTARL